MKQPYVFEYHEAETGLIKGNNNGYDLPVSLHGGTETQPDNSEILAMYPNENQPIKIAPVVIPTDTIKKKFGQMPYKKENRKIIYRPKKQNPVTTTTPINSTTPVNTAPTTPATKGFFEQEVFGYPMSTVLLFGGGLAVSAYLFFGSSKK